MSAIDRGETADTTAGVRVAGSSMTTTHRGRAAAAAAAAVSAAAAAALAVAGLQESGDMITVAFGGNTMMNVAKLFRHAGAALALLLVVSPTPGALAEVTIPARDGAVVDMAKVLGPGEAHQLATQLKSLKARSGVDLFLVTLPSLDG